MRTKTTFLLLLLFNILPSTYAQTCGTNIFIDEFSTDGNLPAEWTEFNTTDQVTVIDGRLQFDYTTDQPSAYRMITPTSDKVTLSFNEESTRNWVKCRFDVLSSDDKYLTSIIFGNDGVGSVQYATALDASNIPTSFTGALVDGTYLKSYEYSFALTLDFASGSFNFYDGGIQRGENISFMQAAGDIAKISITQISMYNGEGRFFFDNISLSYPGPDRTGLSTGIVNAESLIETAIISPDYGNSLASYEALNNTLTQSNAILDNCESTQGQIDAQALAIEDAIAEFENSFRNENVLTLYPAYDFTGSEINIKCGYYNGNMGAYEDKPVSFRLKKGYMATFAQDIDGQGFSQVYIAQDSALEINLPEELQLSISFMRVSPWFSTGKKGSLGKKSWSDEANLNAEWYYNWGMGIPYQNSGYSTPEVQYVPMSWSKGDSWTGSNVVQFVGQNMALNHHLAYNEPDLEDQSNLDVETALEYYPRLLASGLRLGAPAVSNVSYSLTNSEFNEDAWIVAFLDSCIARGYRVDFIPVHDYVRRSPAQYIARFQALSERYNLPIWVTEYNYGNPNMGSPDIDAELALTKITAMTEAFEDADFIERYNWYFFFGGTSNIGAYTDGILNSTGEFYRDLESPSPSYTQEEYEEGPYIEVGMETQVASDAITVYPNPVTNGILTVSLESEDKLKLTLFSITGKQVAQSMSNEINVNTLVNGLYLLKIEQANMTFSKKILIGR